MRDSRIFLLIAAATLCLMAGPACRSGSGTDESEGSPSQPAPAASDKSSSVRGPEVDGLVFPDPANEIWVVKQVPGESETPVGERLPESDPLAGKILAELRLPFNHSVIKLSQCSRNFANRTPGPNVLFLSSEEGGFPRHGLAIREGSEILEYPDLNYVDLVIDERRIAEGELNIYSHELGHVMMMNVGPSLPEREWVMMHVSMGVTDYATAFNEGWGVHFQRLAYDAVPRYEKAFVDGFDYRRLTGRLWHSSIDEELRTNAVPENLYIWQKAMPVEDTVRFSPEQLILLHYTSPLFDHTRLKNGQQMLSCEGLLATLFYRIDTDKTLQDRYLPADFYAPFLIAPIPEGVEPRDIFTPFENVVLKNFYVWSKMKARPEADAGGKPPLFAFLEEWGRAFPEDREEIVRVFLSTTGGRTASTAPGRLLEKVGFAGLIGDYQAFMPAAADYSKALSALTADVLSGKLDPAAALGPEIWVENKDFTIRTTLWSAEDKSPLRVNLNACSRWELMTFPGITAGKARKILAARDKAGFFASVDAARRAGFTGAAK